MTKREICERLFKIQANAMFWCGGENVHYPEAAKVAQDFSEDIQRLLLDLVAPDRPEPEAPKAEEKHPGVIVDQGGKEPPRCLRCNGEAEIVHNGFGLGEDWIYCKKCGVSFRLKRGEGEK